MTRRGPRSVLSSYFIETAFSSARVVGPRVAPGGRVEYKVAVIEEVNGMFDDGVVALVTAIDPAAVDALGPNEAAMVSGAAETRRNEFATARKLARHALARFGAPHFEILHDRNRAPVWPAGLTGTLSHCNSRAFVAIGLREAAGTLGIDAEDERELAKDLWPLVLLPEERVFLDSLREHDRGRTALIIFSAKESLYKAQYPRTSAFMEFSDVRVEMPRFGPAVPVEGTLACVFQRQVGPFAAGTVIPGRFRNVFPGVLATSVQIRDDVASALGAV